MLSHDVQSVFLWFLLYKIIDRHILDAIRFIQFVLKLLKSDVKYIYTHFIFLIKSFFLSIQFPDFVSLIIIPNIFCWSFLCFCLSLYIPP